MNPRHSFFRKIAYFAAIAVLLVPLFWLSQPTTGRVETIDGVEQVVSGSPGGQLARLRAKYGLSEAQLGDLDLAGETLQLATFGLRGVATVVLWEKCNDYKKKKDWKNLAATLNQLAKLEPHFITVWQHQAWNLSYNISSEFDDYRERYHWVIEGIKFLKRGVTLNRRESRLVSDVGWFTAQKIGRADEAKQFRVLFAEDDDFHAHDEEYGGSRPVEFRDNWLVGKYWFGRAEALVDNNRARLGKTSPCLFFSERPMCQMNYSEALEGDGFFGEKARLAWRTASKDWFDYGNREIRKSKTDGIFAIRLNDTELHQEDIKRLNDEIDALAPGVRDSLYRDRVQLLNEEERAILDVPVGHMTTPQSALYRQASAKVAVVPQDVAKKIKEPEDRAKAIKMANQIAEAQRLIRLIDGDRDIVNFAYWRMHANVEQTDQALKARENVYLAGEAAQKGDLSRAKEYFDAGLAEWRKLLDSPEFSFLIREYAVLDDLTGIIDRYRGLLEKRDELFPKPFILQDVIDAKENFSSD